MRGRHYLVSILIGGSVVNPNRLRSVMKFVGYDYRREREEADPSLGEDLVANEGDY